MAKLAKIETEIGAFDVWFQPRFYAPQFGPVNTKFDSSQNCELLQTELPCANIGKGLMGSKNISYQGLVIALSMGHDFSTQDGFKEALNNKQNIENRFMEMAEQIKKFCGDDLEELSESALWSYMVAIMKEIDLDEHKPKMEEKIKKMAAEEEKQVTDSYKHTVKNRLDSLSDSIEDDEKVIAVIYGAEEKKEDGKKTDFWGGVFNEGILIATDRKVIYATRHITSGSINADEFIYASIKGVQKKKSSGGYITINIISVDDQVYGLRFGGDGKELSVAAKEFVNHVNKMISGGGSQVAPAGDDIPTQLKKLADLKDLSIITEEEFEAKKKELLAKM
jgi:hypothetical protein